MIIIDINQVVIAAFFRAIGKHTNVAIEERKIMEIALNCIKDINKQFKVKYGDIVIACDFIQSWRRKEFPHYKAHRKKDRDASDVDWNAFFKCLETFRAGLKEHFPYKVIQVEGAEADDVIASLVMNNLDIDSKTLIISGDKDFMQLQKYENVDQYDFIGKRWLKTNDALGYLKDHILTGDRGDGIPNVLSDGNTFVLSKRQNVLTQKRRKALKESGFENDPNHKYHRNYLRNKKLIDFEEIPDNLMNAIVHEFRTQIPVPNRKQIKPFLIKHRMESLANSIFEF